MQGVTRLLTAAKAIYYGIEQDSESPGEFFDADFACEVFIKFAVVGIRSVIVYYSRRIVEFFQAIVCCGEVAGRICVIRVDFERVLKELCGVFIAFADGAADAEIVISRGV